MSNFIDELRELSNPQNVAKREAMKEAERRTNEAKQEANQKAELARRKAQEEEKEAAQKRFAQDRAERFLEELKTGLYVAAKNNDYHYKGLFRKKRFVTTSFSQYEDFSRYIGMEDETTQYYLRQLCKNEGIILRIEKVQYDTGWFPRAYDDDLPDVWADSIKYTVEVEV